MDVVICESNPLLEFDERFSCCPVMQGLSFKFRERCCLAWNDIRN